MDATPHKDFFGNTIHLGDVVGYRSTTRARRLVRGVVVEFSPKHVIILEDGTKQRSWADSLYGVNCFVDLMARPERP